MQNPFQKMISDVFNCEDFLEDVFIESINYKCIVSPITDNISFSEAGLVDEENWRKLSNVGGCLIKFNSQIKLVLIGRLRIWVNLLKNKSI